jgi:hypothetical protein
MYWYASRCLSGLTQDRIDPWGTKTASLPFFQVFGILRLLNSHGESHDPPEHGIHALHKVLLFVDIAQLRTSLVARIWTRFTEFHEVRADSYSVGLHGPRQVLSISSAEARNCE